MFVPWRGDRWGQFDNALGGVRLLVLGESHHCDQREVGGEDPQMTINVVRAYLDGTLDPSSKRFFTKVGKLIARKPLEEVSWTDLQEVWQACAFYNYVPKIAANGPRQAPPEHLWNVEAPQAFLSVIKRLEVEAILVCGDRLWGRLPEGLLDRPAFTFEGKARRARLYSIADLHRAVAAHMHHPSAPRGWSAARWRPVVGFLFEEVARQRYEFEHLGPAGQAALDLLMATDRPPLTYDELVETNGEPLEAPRGESRCSS